jgi:hypothetical protein
VENEAFGDSIWEAEVDLYEFEKNLVYVVRSWPVRVIIQRSYQRRRRRRRRTTKKKTFDVHQHVHTHSCTPAPHAQHSDKEETVLR